MLTGEGPGGTQTSIVPKKFHVSILWLTGTKSQLGHQGHMLVDDFGGHFIFGTFHYFSKEIVGKEQYVIKANLDVCISCTLKEMILFQSG